MINVAVVVILLLQFVIVVVIVVSVSIGFPIPENVLFTLVSSFSQHYTKRYEHISVILYKSLIMTC